MNIKTEEDLDRVIEIVDALSELVAKIVFDRRRGREDSANSIRERAKRLYEDRSRL